MAGIVVRLPFSTALVCLPVLFRLWAGKATASSVDLAGDLLALIAAAFPDRRVHGVGDAAYHGKPLLVAGTTLTTRLPANAALYDLAPARTGKRGRPALKGVKLGNPGVLAAGAAWRRPRYTATAVPSRCVWQRWPVSGTGSFGNTHGRCVLVREVDSTRAYDLALFTFDAEATLAGVVARYAVRWSIEPSNATGKQQMGVRRARNHLPKAVQRAVPFGMLVQSMVTVWCALSGHHPDDVNDRRQAEPWHDSNTEPSFQDMLVKLRKTLIAARFSAVRPGQTDPIYYVTTPWPAPQPPHS